MARQRLRSHARGMSLFWRVVTINACLLVLAALVLALSPATVSSSLTVTEALVLAIGTLTVIAINVALLRRVFGPLERPAGLMSTIDPRAPGRRIELERPVAEVADLYRAFNASRSWATEDEPPPAEGDLVVVNSVHGLTLLVRRAEEWEVES